jgi:hypothetical protein
MLLTCERSFFRSFPELLMLLMGGNLLSFSLRKSPSNSYRDSDSNPYSIEVVFLMVAMFQSRILQGEMLKIKYVLMQQCLSKNDTSCGYVLISLHEIGKGHYLGLKKVSCCPSDHPHEGKIGAH